MHSRLCEKKERIIPRVVKEFKVVVNFPEECQLSNRVIITGGKKSLEDAKLYLVNLADDLMVSVYGGL